jgi:hypothetical protein
VKELLEKAKAQKRDARKAQRASEGRDIEADAEKYEQYYRNKKFLEIKDCLCMSYACLMQHHVS